MKDDHKQISKLIDAMFSNNQEIFVYFAVFWVDHLKSWQKRDKLFKLWR